MNAQTAFSQDFLDFLRSRELALPSGREDHIWIDAHPVNFFPLENGGTGFETILQPLPATTTERDILVTHLLETAAALAHRFQAHLALSEDGLRLLLQQAAPPNLGLHGFEAHLESYLNALDCFAHAIHSFRSPATPSRGLNR